MRFVFENISLHFISNAPVSFTWRKLKYMILNVQQTWRYRGEWWKQDETREYMLLETNAGVFEIYKLSHNVSHEVSHKVSRIYD